MPRTSITPRKTPKQRRSRLTVEAIVEASFQILGRGSAATLTTTRVAERAGVSVGTLYQYFPTREALMAEVQRRHLAKTAAALREAAERSLGSPFDCRVRAMLHALLEFKRQAPLLNLVLSAQMPRIEGMPSKHQAALHASEQIQDLVREHTSELGGTPPEAAVITVVHAVEGACLRALEDAALLGSQEFEETLVAMAVHGLRRAAAPCAEAVR